MSKISGDPKIEGITVEHQFIMETRKLVTFIRHETALLYAISVLIENILIRRRSSVRARRADS